MLNVRVKSSGKRIDVAYRKREPKKVEVRNDIRSQKETPILCHDPTVNTVYFEFKINDGLETVESAVERDVKEKKRNVLLVCFLRN